MVVGVVQVVRYSTCESRGVYDDWEGGLRQPIKAGKGRKNDNTTEIFQIMYRFLSLYPNLNVCPASRLLYFCRERRYR